MEITAKFNNGEEMMAFAKLLLGNKDVVEPKVVFSQGSKVEEKPTDLKKDLIKTMVEEGDKALEDTKEPEPVEDKKEEPKVTKEMVRAAFAKLIKAGKQKEAKELTSKYKATKVPDIKEEDYAAVLKDAEELL
jgi:hypothetical protein